MNLLDQIRDQQLRMRSNTIYGSSGSSGNDGYNLLDTVLNSVHTDETFMGIRVFQSPLCVQTVPVRQHKQRKVPVLIDFGILKGFHTRDAHGNYHARVQKKWNKRYGFKQQYSIYLTNGGRDMFIHPDQWQRVILEMEPLK